MIFEGSMCHGLPSPVCGVYSILDPSLQDGEDDSDDDAEGEATGDEGEGEAEGEDDDPDQDEDEGGPMDDKVPACGGSIPTQRLTANPIFTRGSWSEGLGGGGGATGNGFFFSCPTTPSGKSIGNSFWDGHEYGIDLTCGPGKVVTTLGEGNKENIFDTLSPLDPIPFAVFETTT